MTDKEKLIELLDNIVGFPATVLPSEAADYLLANGVTIPVRCKDCKHHSTYVCRNDFTGISHRCECGVSTYDYDFYCAYGERRADNGDG